LLTAANIILRLQANKPPGKKQLQLAGEAHDALKAALHAMEETLPFALASVGLDPRLALEGMNEQVARALLLPEHISSTSEKADVRKA
jgi:hypothetical protein